MGNIEQAFVRLAEAFRDPSNEDAARAATGEVFMQIGSMLDRFIMAVEAIEMNTRENS